MSDTSDSEEFEELFLSYRDYLNERLEAFSSCGTVKRIYVQFQYDCSGLPSAASSLKVGKYSHTNQHIEAYLPVTASDFSGVDELSRRKLIGYELVRALKVIAARLAGTIENNIDKLITEVEAANEDLMS